MIIARFLCLLQPVPIVQVNTALSDANVHDLREQKMADSSGDQFQRVLLARAQLNQPEL